MNVQNKRSSVYNHLRKRNYGFMSEALDWLARRKGSVAGEFIKLYGTRMNWASADEWSESGGHARSLRNMMDWIRTSKKLGFRSLF